jgi:hypothetical protein
MIFSTYCDLELRQRFTEDMDIRKLKAEIQINYLRAIIRLCEYLKSSPSGLPVEVCVSFNY